MKKSLICCTAVAFALSLAVAGASLAADKGPAEMVMKTAEGKKPAKFPHKAHQDKLKCADCHHGKDAAGKQVAYTDALKIEKCDSCHNDKMANTNLNDLKKAAHKNCKDCHASQKDKPNLNKCNTCHAK
ncbi:MAG: hypothetical protein A2511_13330 [Deltaproteobacteria bacterium RIFOXYD12_FULL_50_9]|nr:MAG: hypothetical protein A2511_13330 [Deltaproteobacteria bacterium RIFOXYD12_FULL_50_9]